MLMGEIPFLDAGWVSVELNGVRCVPQFTALSVYLQSCGLACKVSRKLLVDIM